MWLLASTKIAILILIIAMVLSFNGKMYFIFDNLSSFRAHFAVLLLLGCAAFLYFNSPVWFALAGLAFTICMASILPWYWRAPEEAVEGTSRPIKLLSSNVSPRNTDFLSIKKLVAKQQPDVLGLIELTPTFLEQIADVTEMYPYRFEAPKETFWGLAVYSRLPIQEATLLDLGYGVPVAIIARVSVDQTLFQIIVAHPYPPMTADMAKRRNAQLMALAECIKKSELPTIVMGDLNTALWSPYYRGFVESAGLRNARKGYGVSSTWPAIYAVGVPIDHILSTKIIFLSNFRVLDGIGSDHFPVSAVAWIRASRSQDGQSKYDRAVRPLMDTQH